MEDGDWSGNGTFFKAPGMVTFYIVTLVGLLIPLLTLDVFLLASICVARTVAVQIRVSLVSIILSALITIFALIWENLTAVVLATTHSNPPGLPYCAFILYLIVAGGSARYLFTATFCVVVFVVIRWGVVAIKMKGLIIATILIWILSSIICTPMFSPMVVEMTYFGGVACFAGPSGPNRTNLYQLDAANTAVVSFLFVTSAVLPTVITTIAPCLSLWAFQKMSHDAIEVPLKKALTQLALFLIFENIANVLGLGIPVLVSYFYSKDQNGQLIAFCLCNVLIALSMFVTPVIITVLLKGVRRSLKILCLCVCFSNSGSEGDRLLTLRQ